MPRVFDCVILDNELGILETRFRAYQDIPEVTHVIVEAAPACFPESGLAFSWRGRWNHVRVEEDEIPRMASRKKTLQQYMMTGINGEPGDIIMHTEIDEIPVASLIRDLARRRFTSPGVMDFNWHVHKADLLKEEK
jgi:hypothetical protein